MNLYHKTLNIPIVKLYVIGVGSIYSFAKKITLFKSAILGPPSWISKISEPRHWIVIGDRKKSENQVNGVNTKDTSQESEKRFA